jgi:hypothetical protein
LNSGKCIVKYNWTAPRTPTKVITTIHQLAAVCKKYKGIVFTEKDRNIEMTQMFWTWKLMTLNHTITINEQEWMTTIQTFTEMDATSQTGITQENKPATQAKSQEWTATTQATQRITMFRTLKQWDNTRTPMMITIYPSKKNRL